MLFVFVDKVKQEESYIIDCVKAEALIKAITDDNIVLVKFFLKKDVIEKINNFFNMIVMVIYSLYIHVCNFFFYSCFTAQKMIYLRNDK